MSMHQEVFQDFTTALGQLMQTGLNDLKPEMKKHVVQAVDDGAQIIAVCGVSPVSLSALLLYKSEQPSLELFRITADLAPRPLDH